MKNILAVDIGGSSIKSGVWNGKQLNSGETKATPETWQEMKAILDCWVEKTNAVGVAISCPGTVDITSGIISGISAIPYIHNFPIKKELEQSLQRPVTLQNDANCAALAELWVGNAQERKQAAFLIIGSGVGGAYVIDGKLQPGVNLFGGEFGYQIVDSQTLATFSEAVSPVSAARLFSVEVADGIEYSGQEMFELAASSHPLAQKKVEQIYHVLSIGIYNILLSIDPGLIIIGGAISQRAELITELTQRVDRLLSKNGAQEIHYQINTCKFLNDSNLYGAIRQFQIENGD